MLEQVLQVEDLKTYFALRGGFRRRGYVKAVDGVDICLNAKETLAVVGESGSGKTTLGKTCLRLVEPYGGKIQFRDRDITHLKESQLHWYRKEAQIIYQDPFSSLNPFFTVGRAVEEPLIVQKFGDRAEHTKMVNSALEDVRLTPVADFADKNPHMLSGGQRQRVAIARAMILNPKFVVADEPVSMLDMSVRVEILLLLRSLQEEHGISFMYITHDIATVKYFSERIAIMYASKMVELGPTREVIYNPLHPYTKALIEAVPEPDPTNRFRRRAVIAGEPPDPSSPPSGCRFHPRCPIADRICSEKEPELTEMKSGHCVACFFPG